MEGIGRRSVRNCLGFLFGKTEGNHEHLDEGRWVQVREKNPRPPNHEAGRHPLDGSVGWQGIK